MYWLSLFTMLVFFGLIVGGFYSFNRAQLPVKLFDIHNEPIPTSRPTYQRGDVPRLFADFCKLVEGSTTISVTMIGTDSGPLGSYVSDTPKGCYRVDDNNNQIYFRMLPIPFDTEPGIYVMKITMRQRVSFLRIETQVTESQPFEVLAGRVLYLP